MVSPCQTPPSLLEGWPEADWLPIPREDVAHGRAPSPAPPVRDWATEVWRGEGYGSVSRVLQEAHLRTDFSHHHHEATLYPRWSPNPLTWLMKIVEVSEFPKA